MPVLHSSARTFVGGIKKGQTGDDGHFGNVLLSHGDLVEAPHQINPGEDGHPGQLAIEVGDVGQREAVVGGNDVEAVIVLAGH